MTPLPLCGERERILGLTSRRVCHPYGTFDAYAGGMFHFIFGLLMGVSSAVGGLMLIVRNIRPVLAWSFERSVAHAAEAFGCWQRSTAGVMLLFASATFLVGLPVIWFLLASALLIWLSFSQERVMNAFIIAERRAYVERMRSRNREIVCSRF